MHTTQRQVTILEAGKLAHGASGHNAGQLSLYLERSHELLQR
ncbi:MAG: hypothetical protein H6765_00275 [Candidatus Peribacteria bacterium]|nr:MAG: hypothetical protein H6765_00275 [Candidatus Peribacteria bacterium]